MILKIDKKSPLPLYYQLAEALKREIREEGLKPGDRLPTHRELMSSCELSHDTVARALRALVDDGYIERFQGQGTFVSERKVKPATIALLLTHLCVSGGDERTLYDTETLPLVMAIENEVKRCGASLLMRVDSTGLDDSLEELIEKERENLLYLLDLKVDGVIVPFLLSIENEPILDRMRDAGIHVVLSDRADQLVQYDSASSKDMEGAYHITKALIDKGFERVYYFSAQGDTATYKQREDGYRSALADAGLSSDGLFVEIPYDIRFSEMQRKMKAAVGDTLRGVSAPYAVFTSDRVPFEAAWSAVSELGVDYSRIGMACFHGIKVDLPSQMFCVEAPLAYDEIGKACVHIVMDRLSGDREAKKVTIMPHIRTVAGGIASSLNTTSSGR